MAASCLGMSRCLFIFTVYVLVYHRIYATAAAINIDRLHAAISFAWEKTSAKRKEKGHPVPLPLPYIYKNCRRIHTQIYEGAKREREAYVERQEAAKSGQFLEFGNQKLRPLIRYLIL
jgi:hypothetical protein